MAYIKGGTVVDGNLYIEGGLKVKQISTSEGSLTYLSTSDSSVPNRLVKFIDSTGGLHYSNIQEKLIEDGVEPLEYTLYNKSLDGTSSCNEFNLLLNDYSVCNVKFKNPGNPTASLVLSIYPKGISEPVQTLTFNASGLIYSLSPDKISLADKDLSALIKDANGTITIDGVKYRVINEGEVPDLFYYI